MRPLFYLITISLAVSACTKLNEESILKEAQLKELCNVDTASYSLHVQPIVLNNCMPCHSTTRADGGIALETYADISNYTATDYLVQTIKHQSGVAPMPKDADQLHECEIQVIERWIQQGGLNN